MRRPRPNARTIVLAWAWAWAVVVCGAAVDVRAQNSPAVAVDPGAAPRVRYGAERLTRALAEAGVDTGGRQVVVGTLQSPGIRGLVDSGQLKLPEQLPGREGFVLATCPDGQVAVAGVDDSGALYGALELAERVRESGGTLPADLHFSDAPAMVLRGPCIGMQKTYILPGRKVYEYPYTPDLFPFFYDKAFWAEYLDFLAEHRFNSLYLWNGHPFASLVRLPDYPEALEVSEEQFERNVEMFRYITAEADKRGIWVVQQFYSVLISKPLAERHGLETQLAESTPLVDDYMRKSIAEFVRQYPSVGLMPCLGEALQGQENQNRFLTDVILAGIKDGARAAGLTEEPPVVIRTHATDLRQAMPEALKVYKNLYTEAKFNGESLTTWEPRGVRQEVHLAMSRLGSMHLINVHILANLEPFRYGAQRFIQKSVQAGRDRLGAKGLHLYPLFYWDWPVSPDKAEPALKQWERDWIWFDAWARYAWDPDVDPAEDRQYWLDRLGAMYGSREAAGHILDAYNDAGECAPRILRRFGITEGNRQAMSLGMLLDQLVNPEKYRPFPELWESQSPPGERLQEYVERAWNRQPHEGETPPQIIAEVLEFSRKAVEAIDAAAPHVTKNQAEFERLRNDVRCIHAMSQSYAAKANAAIHVLRYNFSKDVADMERAEGCLAESLAHYKELARLTADTYRYASSMQTNMRKIPVTGALDGKPANVHWTQLVPVYEAELSDFRLQLERLRRGEPIASADESKIERLPRVAVKVLTDGAEAYDVQPNARVFTDAPYALQSIAPELQGLFGIRFSRDGSRSEQFRPIEFEAAEPVKVLVGYVKGDAADGWRRPPDLETDAAGDARGGAEVKLRNVVTISGLPPVDVHALTFDAGRHTLDVRGTGSFVVLGVVPASAEVPTRDAQRPGGVAAGRGVR